MTWEIHKKEFENVLKMNGPERYDYFIRKVADWEEVWSLKAEGGWAMVGSSDSDECIPFWPHPEYARVCAKDRWEEYSPEAISINVFMEKWLVGMSNDGINAAIFQLPQNKGVVVTPEKILSDLRAELEQYE
jgi:hypothetical protein